MINSKGHMEQTNPEIGVLTDAELDSISGGDMMGMAINAAERYMNGLFGRLIEAVHKKA